MTNKNLPRAIYHSIDTCVFDIFEIVSDSEIRNSIHEKIGNWTPLMFACLNADEDMVFKILSYGANINDSYESKSPLVNLVRNQSEPLIMNFLKWCYPKNFNIVLKHQSVFKNVDKSIIIKINEFITPVLKFDSHVNANVFKMKMSNNVSNIIHWYRKETQGFVS